MNPEPERQSNDISEQPPRVRHLKGDVEIFEKWKSSSRVGTIIGAVAGLIVGLMLGSSGGTVGTVAGGLVGATIGALIGATGDLLFLQFGRAIVRRLKVLQPDDQ